MKITRLGAENTIIDTNVYFYTLPATISDAGITANSDGKKIIMQGTPLGAATDVLLDRSVKLSPVTAENSAQAQAVALHDIDVTDGETSVAVAFAGVIDLDKVDDTVADLLVSVKSNLPRILLMRRN